VKENPEKYGITYQAYEIYIDPDDHITNEEDPCHKDPESHMCKGIPNQIYHFNLCQYFMNTLTYKNN